MSYCFHFRFGDGTENRHLGASPDEINALPTSRYIDKKPSASLNDNSTVSNNNNDSNQHDSCTICLESFKHNEEIRMLPCLHVFHSTCVDNWLRRCATCPICKLSIKR